MNPTDIKRALRLCGKNTSECAGEECPYHYLEGKCTGQLIRDAFVYIEQLEARCNSSIDAVEFLNRLHEWQAHAVINELTESKAVFDISIAIVEDLVKECNNDND